MSQLQVNRINDASGGVLAPISSVMRNRLIDAGFTINQRGYVSNTALASGVYAHDRWKAGSGGCTYTFTQGSLGVPIVITITAGSLQQVIEGANMPEGGTYVLSWTGTAQARFNGGTYGSSPLAVTGITAGANTTIEFNTGTCSFPQLERGTQATSFEYRQYGTELALCQRYYYRNSAGGFGGYAQGTSYGTTSIRFTIAFPVTMRIAPSSYDFSAANTFLCELGTSSSSIPSAVGSTGNNTPNTLQMSCTVTGAIASSAYILYSNGTSSFIGVGAEL